MNPMPFFSSPKKLVSYLSPLLTMFGSTLFAINNGSQASSKVALALFTCMHKERMMLTPGTLHDVFPACHSACKSITHPSVLTGNLLTQQSLQIRSGSTPVGEWLQVQPWAMQPYHGHHLYDWIAGTRAFIGLWVLPGQYLKWVKALNTDYDMRVHNWEQQDKRGHRPQYICMTHSSAKLLHKVVHEDTGHSGL